MNNEVEFETVEEQAILMAVGRTIVELRLENRMSQKELAEMSGLAERNLQKLERGKSSGKFFTIYQLCRAMGVGMDEFVRRMNENIKLAKTVLNEFYDKKRVNQLKAS